MANHLGYNPMIRLVLEMHRIVVFPADLGRK
jgi:hypothetical protein